MINIALTGASGRMGQALVRLIIQNPNTTLVGASVRASNSHIGEDASEYGGGEKCGVVFSDDISAVFASADVVIDFCPAGSTQQHLDCAKKHNTKLIIGTTGLDEKIEKNIADTAKHIAIVYASNFSVGVNLLFAMAEKSAKVLTANGFEAHIDETHHIHKLDAPSGTALSLGKAVAKGRNVDFNDVYKYEQQRENSADITFTDHRDGETIGDHTLTFQGDLESISLTHNAHNRDVFANGAIIAGLWLSNKDKGLYTMGEVLGI